MKSFWLKISGVVVLIVSIALVAYVFRPGGRTAATNSTDLEPEQNIKQSQQQQAKSIDPEPAAVAAKLQEAPQAKESAEPSGYYTRAKRPYADSAPANQPLRARRPSRQTRHQTTPTAERQTGLQYAEDSLNDRNRVMRRNRSRPRLQPTRHNPAKVLLLFLLASYIILSSYNIISTHNSICQYRSVPLLLQCSITLE